MTFVHYSTFLTLKESNGLFHPDFEDFLVDSHWYYEFAMLCMGGEL